MSLSTTVHPTHPTTRGPMLLVGGGVLAISIAAFFRVPLLPMIGSDLGMSASQLGLVTTAFAVGRLASDIPAGRLTSQVQPVPLLAAAALVLAVGSALLATARFPLWVIAAAFVLGIASAVANVKTDIVRCLHDSRRDLHQAVQRPAGHQDRDETAAAGLPQPRR